MTRRDEIVPGCLAGDGIRSPVHRVVQVRFEQEDEVPGALLGRRHLWVDREHFPLFGCVAPQADIARCLLEEQSRFSCWRHGYGLPPTAVVHDVAGLAVAHSAAMEAEDGR